MKKLFIFIASVLGILLFLMMSVSISIIFFNRDLLASYDFKSDYSWIIILLVISILVAIIIYLSVYPIRIFEKNTESERGIVLTEGTKLTISKILNALQLFILILAFLGFMCLIGDSKLIVLFAFAIFLIENKDRKLAYSLIALTLATYYIIQINNEKQISQVKTFSGYVYAFPDANNDKNYRLKADITKTRNNIFVNKIYFKNGGYITFDEDYNAEQNDINEDGSGYIAPVNSSCIPHYDAEKDQEWCIRYFGEKIK